MTVTESLALLQSGLVGRLGMIGPDSRPYVIPLRFVWHKHAVYVRLAYDGRKQDAIEHGRRICFETDECRDDFSHYASVIVEGTLMDVLHDEEKRDALVALNEKYERLARIPSPGPHPVIHGVAIRKIVVDRMSGRKREPEPPSLKRRPAHAQLMRHGEVKSARVKG